MAICNLSVHYGVSVRFFNLYMFMCEQKNYVTCDDTYTITHPRDLYTIVNGSDPTWGILLVCSRIAFGLRLHLLF